MTFKQDREDKMARKKKMTVTSRRSGRVDKGKVFALHDAGWPAAKIADEVGCSNKNVYAILKGKRPEAEEE